MVTAKKDDEGDEGQVRAVLLEIFGYAAHACFPVKHQEADGEDGCPKGVHRADHGDLRMGGARGGRGDAGGRGGEGQV